MSRVDFNSDRASLPRSVGAWIMGGHCASQWVEIIKEIVISETEMGWCTLISVLPVVQMGMNRDCFELARHTLQHSYRTSGKINPSHSISSYLELHLVTGKYHIIAPHSQMWIAWFIIEKGRSILAKCIIIISLKLVKSQMLVIVPKNLQLKCKIDVKMVEEN